MARIRTITWQEQLSVTQGKESGIAAFLPLGSSLASTVHLTDSDPKIRFAAVVLMTHHWEQTEDFKNKCEEMALQDPDPTVRSKALGSLGSCFARTDNRRIGKLLANVTLDESESYRIRRSAYMALFLVNSQTFDHMPAGELFSNLRIPQDLDLTFLGSMLT